MNNTTSIDTQTISDIVLSTQDAISTLLNPLLDLGSNIETLPDFDSIKNDILVQFENISMIAEMSDLNGLAAVCVEFSVQLKDLILSNKQNANEFKKYLDSNIEKILIYLSDWQSLDSIEQLTDNLSGDADDIRVLLFQDIENCNSKTQTTLDSDVNLDVEIDDSYLLTEGLVNSSTLSNVDEDEILELDSLFAEDTNAEVGLDTTEGIMALFCQELSDIEQQIIMLTPQICNSEIKQENDSTPEQAVQYYLDIINRMRNSCEELELTGLVKILNFVLVNVNLLLTLDITTRKQSHTVLVGWPQIVINHLQEPNDNSLCLAVVDYLEDNSWPEPLQYSEMREFIEALTKELELTGDFEVEARKVEALEDDVTLTIAQDTNQQLLDAFFAECPGYAEELTIKIANIVNGKDILNNTKAAQRLAHSIKGSANLIGTKGIANIAHHLEDIFEYFAKLSIAPPKSLGDTITEAADVIEVMIESLQELSPAPVDAHRILQDVLDWANRIDKGDINETTEIITEKVLDNKTEIIATDDITTNDETKQGEENQQAINPILTQTELIRVPRDTLDQIFNLIGETSIAIAQVQEQLKRMHQRGIDMQAQEKNLQTRRFELENLVSVRSLAATQKQLNIVASNEQFDSLEMDQYDDFYGATHSFIEAVSDHREFNRDVMSHIVDLEGLFLQQQRLNRSLENIVTTTRLLPVKTIVARLQRTVRQACRATGKQAELNIVGEQLLMDGDVLNQLADPLMHLLRNAIDHGIESLEERREKGKPDIGKITLNFYQEGNNIRANCSDDGAGLDYERIHWLALERDLIKPQDNVDHASLARLILNSGFSTRETATQISGRGVGMDVVYVAVLKLKGNISISDNEPCGTIFNLRLPITLLTSHSILVQIQSERYAIPTVMLDQILPQGTGQFSSHNEKQTFQLGKSVYPTSTLSNLLGLPENPDPLTNKNSIVLLVHYGSKTVAVSVERILSSNDLVVKNMGPFMKHVAGIAGIALLGDGGVVPVLDMIELLDAEKSGNNKIRSSRIIENEKLLLSKVLIVDDSLSVRNSLFQLVQDAGYEPLLARDGLEAIEIMKKTRPNLILTDLEMPRMTGLELTSHVRANSDNVNLPIFMITSRTMAKHQTQAQKLGVNEYITKPFSEDDLVSKLGQALNG
ncbi:Signal transduction histidine kinase CheA [hydrothermal vent metagenome]|uniref:histidine kinase n=1 Tax=hydrothermal vent metagenome TaxID=652676 RepID=A0A3B0ZVD1_9ZZZZ